IVALLLELVQSVQALVAEVFERLAAPSVRAALGDNLHQAARRQSELGGKPGGVDLELLDRPLRKVLPRLAFLGPRVVDAVDQKSVRVEAGAGADGDVVVEGSRSVLTGARHQKGEVQELPRIDRKTLDL